MTRARIVSDFRTLGKRLNSDCLGAVDDEDEEEEDELDEVEDEDTDEEEAPETEDDEAADTEDEDAAETEEGEDEPSRQENVCMRMPWSEQNAFSSSISGFRA